jgi:hypothetical protein
MSIVATTDFANGRYKIPQNPKQTVALQEVIDYVEAYYLPRLMGVALNVLFQADLSGGVPVSARFLSIFNAFTVQDNQLVSSEGMKTMLKGFVYFRYQREVNNRSTTVGAQQATPENAKVSTVDALGINSRFNEAIANYNAIQYYMTVEDADTYPEYTGVIEKYNHPF